MFISMRVKDDRSNIDWPRIAVDVVVSASHTIIVDLIDAKFIHEKTIELSVSIDTKM